MDLIRDQGFREQRGEYGSRVGGDSLDVGVCISRLISQSDRHRLINFVGVIWRQGSSSPVCSRNCDW